MVENAIDESVDTAEIYSPATGSFVPTGSMNQARAFPAAALLPDGSVLVAGGLSINGFGQESVLAKAEIYDPATGTWTPTTPMQVAGDGLTATELGNGDVLVIGFPNDVDPELYDPATATWSNTGPMPPGGYGVSALLHDGQVLAAGGQNGASALYNPITNTWSATAALATSHDDGTATVLADGEVLVVGGLGPDGGSPLSSAELYDPTTATWSTAASLPADRYAQSGSAPSQRDRAGGRGLQHQLRQRAGHRRDALVRERLLEPDGLASRGPDRPVGQRSARRRCAPGRRASRRRCLRHDDRRVVPAAAHFGHAVPGAPGEQITLTGNGFYAHEEVSVTLGSRVLASPVSDSRGQFVTPVTVPAVHAGTYQLTAEGQISHVYAEGTLVVTAAP